MTKFTLMLAPILLIGCVGDGGGSAYQGQIGDEQGNKSPESGFGGTDGSLFSLCMSICLQDASDDDCRTDICAQLDTTPRPDTPSPSPEPGDGDGDGDNGDGDFAGDGDNSSGDQAFCSDLTFEQLETYCSQGGFGCENACSDL